MSASVGARKLSLLLHISSSVGWFGAVVAFLALAVVGVTSQNEQLARSAYLVMEPVAWYVIVPLNVASLVTGLLTSMVTPWGLLRHYWVLAKLLINLVATVVLLLYMRTLGYLADLAHDDSAAPRDPSPVLHTGAATVLLVLAMVLAVYKPRGLTGYGQRAALRRTGRTRENTVDG
jgi:uncharacterized membrane protein